MPPNRNRRVSVTRTHSAWTAAVVAALIGSNAFAQAGPDVLKGSAAAVRSGPNWTLAARKAPWQARDSHGEFVHDGQIWIVGGWVDAKSPNLLDVWKSPDGKNWTRVLETGPWTQTDLPASLVFDGKMWLMGGRKVPGTECSNKVWSSTDGVDWTLVTPEAGWSPRLAPGFAVFRNRMWVLGGVSDFYQNNDETLFNDVWSSADGKEWKRETANAGWSRRGHGQALAFDGKLWMLGGGARSPRAVPTNDVWCSEDGATWTQVTPAAAWKPRIWFATAVYRDRMWVLGGWSETQGNFGDVWYSKDGRNWTELKSNVIWTRRHELSAFVFQDKLWAAAGAAGPLHVLSSEVWNLELPRDWSREP